MGMAGGLSVRWSAFATATVLLSTLAVFGTAVPAFAAGEGTIFSLVNQARAEQGLGPLQLNSSISSVSSAWAEQMAANGAMTHNPSYSSQIPGGWTKAGENVAQGWPSPSAVHNAWMNSAGHRANILGDYTDIGISFLTMNGTTWAVEDFAKYGGSVPPPAPAAAPAPAPAPAPAAPAPAPKPPAPSAQTTSGSPAPSTTQAPSASAASSSSAAPSASPSPSSAAVPLARDSTPPSAPPKVAAAAAAPVLIPLAAFSDIWVDWLVSLRIIVAMLLTLAAAVVARITVLRLRRRAVSHPHR